MTAPGGRGGHGGGLDRRAFLRAGVSTAGAMLLAPILGEVAAAKELTATGGPYGALQPPDALGLMLPKGFTAREIARYDQPVGASGYRWHLFPDGGATFAVGGGGAGEGNGGGWVYVSNSEVTAPEGGVGAIRFDADGKIVDAYRILDGTGRNCAGGATPWGTWLSCEEHEQGRVWECDPSGARDGRPLPALGVFVHEAVAVDPDGERLYLTEDAGDGRWYRFTPDAYPDLDAGRLEVAAADSEGFVTWLPVPDASAGNTPTRRQVPASSVFGGGEGTCYRAGRVYFVTKHDQKVWSYDVRRQRVRPLYDPATAPKPPVLSGPDNLLMSSFGDLIVCEDTPDDQELVMITPGAEIAPILRLTGQTGSELAGPAFDPSGTRLYVSSQRGGDGGGVTYEISGPFRRVTTTTTTATSVAGSTPPSTTVAGAPDRRNRGGSEGGFPVAPVAGGAAALVALATAGIWRLRARRPST